MTSADPDLSGRPSHTNQVASSRGERPLLSRTAKVWIEADIASCWVNYAQEAILTANFLYHHSLRASSRDTLKLAQSENSCSC